MKKALVVGSCGLVGSESVKFLLDKNFEVFGIDNNMREYFFGGSASTKPMMDKLIINKFYKHYDVDIRDYKKIEDIFKINKFDLIIHTAAQPSHDWAVKEPLTDFTINANGTLNILENFRLYCPEATFIFTSTNKVYGDRPNFVDKYNITNLKLIELETRYEVLHNEKELIGINETMSIDNSKHSLFGASKVSADILVQEYGKYFNLNTVCFRGGCLTGPGHKGAELHGFLSYLIKCIVKKENYKIFGYKGKQVRDNIHSYDLVNMFWFYHQNPKPGEVYNVGGGRENSISIIEAIKITNNLIGENWEKYEILETPRVGDHIWYITDYTKFKKDFPKWEITIRNEDIIQQIITSVK
jgi:CDP-paratose 2-epimerase